VRSNTWLSGKDADELEGRLHVRHEVPVRENGALGVAGRTRRIDDARPVVFADGRDAFLEARCFLSGALINELADGHDIFSDIIVEYDDVLQARQIGADGVDLFHLAARGHEDCTSLRIPQHVFDLIGRQRCVDGNVDAARG
jgi:hypothetical protein